MTAAVDLARTPKDAALQLGINPRTLARWADEGRIGCHRIGTMRRYPQAEIDRLKAQSYRPAAAPTPAGYRPPTGAGTETYRVAPPPARGRKAS